MRKACGRCHTQTKARTGKAGGTTRIEGVEGAEETAPEEVVGTSRKRRRRRRRSRRTIRSSLEGKMGRESRNRARHPSTEGFPLSRFGQDGKMAYER